MSTANDAFPIRGLARSASRSWSLRAWSVRHARGLEIIYRVIETLLRRLHPLLVWIGYAHLERSTAALERAIKGPLFDCRMCGQCILSSTGMSCPMNCPKALRNGPCGGVRSDGGCEVHPKMRCVWVSAWNGAEVMSREERILNIQPPIDHRKAGSSSWLAVASGDVGS